MHRTVLLLFLAAAAGKAFAAAFPVVSREEAEKGGEVCLTGVVTCVAYWQRSSCVIASPDDPNGVSVYVTGQHPDRPSTPFPEGGVHAGDILEVRGNVVPMMFAPGVAATNFVRLGRMELPEAPMREVGDYAFGRLDNRRARIAGVVRSARSVAPDQTDLTLGSREGVLSARVHAPAGRLEPLTDAEVVLDGIVMSRYNHRAEFLGIRFEVAGMEGVRVVKEAPEDPFAVRKIPLGAIMAWSPGGPDGHRVRVEGIVTASFDDGVFYLQSGNVAIRAVGRPAHGESVAEVVGCEVEAVGFPEMADGVGQLAGAVWRRTPAGLSPSAEPSFAIPRSSLTNLTYHSDLTYIDYDCRLVRLTGRLIHLKASGARTEIELDVDGTGVDVSLPGPAPRWLTDEAASGPLLEVTGIVRLDVSALQAGGRRPGLAAIRIESRGADDIVLVPDAAWSLRRRRRFFRLGLDALAASSVFFLVVAVWFWRRARERKREMRLLEKERRRMADDLHDTIEQHLAGVRILLSSARGKLPAEGCGAVDKALDMASRVLNEAKGEIREVIMNLRSDHVLSRPLADLLREFADATNRSGAVRVRCSLRALDVELPAVVKSDIMMIVQQAAANAIRHGGAKNVAIVCDPAAGRREGFVLRVLNDGAPFDVAKVPGPELGHFGLSSMRERAKRSGMAICWGMEGKWTCVKIER